MRKTARGNARRRNSFCPGASTKKRRRVFRAGENLCYNKSFMKNRSRFFRLIRKERFTDYGQHRHSRLRFPVHPAHRPPRARAESSQRDPALRRHAGADRLAQADRPDHLRRPEERHRARFAAPGRGLFRHGTADPRHLLRDAAHGRPLRRRRAPQHRARVRPRHADRQRARLPVFCRRAREIAGVDEPRR